MLMWDLVAAAVMAAAVTTSLGVILGWRQDDRRHWFTSGILVFSLIFAGAWAVGAWLSPYDGQPLSGMFWATYAVSAAMVGLAVAAVLPQRILHQSIERTNSIQIASVGEQIGGIVYCLVMTGLVVLIVRHYML